MRITRIKSQELRIKNNDGFTLLELLVVIGIIGLLISIAAVSYSAAQGKTRDARRKADIKGIQAAMEQAYSASATSSYPGTSTCPVANASSCTAISSYFSSGTIPVDPGTNAYLITVSSTSTYTVCATLENASTFCLSQLQ